MGSPKQLLAVNGVTLLRHAVTTALAADCHPVVVVTGAYADKLAVTLAGLSVAVVHNAQWQQGIGTSVHAGISALMAHNVAAAIIALADQPLLSRQSFNRLIDAYRLQAAPIVTSEYESTLGTPALFDASLFSQLLALPPGKGCKNLILNYPAASVIRCPCPEAGADIDTQDDYARWLHNTAGRPQLQ
jgi:molybdenum cofactor cytidylyltransferase